MTVLQVSGGVYEAGDPNGWTYGPQASGDLLVVMLTFWLWAEARAMRGMRVRRVEVCIVCACVREGVSVVFSLAERRW